MCLVLMKYCISLNKLFIAIELGEYSQNFWWDRQDKSCRLPKLDYFEMCTLVIICKDFQFKLARWFRHKISSVRNCAHLNIDFFLFHSHITLHTAQSGRETWNEKNFSRFLDGATRMALMRALKWAPTWYVSADFPTFISYPDLIQRLAIKGIWDVSWDLSSGGSFQSSQWACWHGTLQNPWEVFFHFESLSRPVIVMQLHMYIAYCNVINIGKREQHSKFLSQS